MSEDPVIDRLRELDEKLSQPQPDPLMVAIETSADAVIVADKDGIIKLANSWALLLFGYEEKEELIGQPVEVLVLEEDRVTHEQLRKTYVSAPHPVSIDSRPTLRARMKDGTVVYVHIGIVTLKTENNLFCIVTIRKA